MKGVIFIPRKTKECHLFYGIGDDEIQVDSFDKKLNESVLKLAEDEPSSVYIIGITHYELLLIICVFGNSLCTYTAKRQNSVYFSAE